MGRMPCRREDEGSLETGVLTYCDGPEQLGMKVGGHRERGRRWKLPKHQHPPPGGLPGTLSA